MLQMVLIILVFLSDLFLQFILENESMLIEVVIVMQNIPIFCCIVYEEMRVFFQGLGN